MPHTKDPKRWMPPRKDDIRHRLITPAIVRQEHLALLAESEHPDAYRRSAARLNQWISQGPGADVDLQPIG